MPTIPQPDDDDYEFEDYLDTEPEQPHGLRFGEGQPINRAGRPRGSPNMATIVRRVAGKRHKIRIDGRARTKTTLQLVFLAVQKKAAQGDLKAYALQNSLLAKFGPQQIRQQGVFIAPKKRTIDEFVVLYDASVSDEEAEKLAPYLMPWRPQYLRGIERRERERAEGLAAYTAEHLRDK